MFREDPETMGKLEVNNGNEINKGKKEKMNVRHGVRQVSLVGLK